MIDLVKALRSRATWETATGITEPHEHIDWMAADEITRLREENARLREELQKGFTAMRVFARYRELEAEIETLRKAVKSAYYEGWQDNASIEDTEDRLHAEWEHSEACAAIREGDGG